MAEASPGWLISEEGLSPYRRSLQLFGTFLDDEQKHQVERWKGLAHHEGVRVYWISLDGPPKCALLDSETIVRYCIAPKEKNTADRMPPPDVALTYLLWLRHDPVGFRKEANVMASESMPEDLCGDDLYEYMARKHPRHRDRPTLRGPAYRALRRGPLVTPQQRSIGISKARDLRASLKADELRDYFSRNGVTVDEKTLPKLAATG